MDSNLNNTVDQRTSEAARYALTRRLLPMLRHHMVVHLQPIGMIYEVLDRKLGVVAPDLVAVREGLAKINQLARSAVTSSLDVVTWLAPDASAVTNVGAGVHECLDLLHSNLAFRGFTVCNEVGDVPQQVLQSALREVLTAALISLTDSAAGPVEVVLSGAVSSGQAVISIHTRPGQGTGFTTEMSYRAVAWSDVQALAYTHAVDLSVLGPAVQIRFALVV